MTRGVLALDRLAPDVLYTRTGCHLCEDAEAALGLLGWPYTRAEISGDADLERRYGWDVPVLVRGETVLLKGVITRARLQRLRDGAARPNSGGPG